MNNFNYKKLIEEQKRFQMGRIIFFGAGIFCLALGTLCGWVGFLHWGSSPEWIRTIQMITMIGIGLLSLSFASEISEELGIVNRELEV